MSEQTKKAARCCGNCHYFNGQSSCTAPVPVSLRWRVNVGRWSMLPTNGADCAAHRMRSTRKVKVAREAAA